MQLADFGWIDDLARTVPPLGGRVPRSRRLRRYSLCRPNADRELFVFASLITTAKRLVGMVGTPALMRQAMLQRARNTPFWKLVDYDAVDSPQAAYGIMQAARQAQAIGITRLSIAQFGLPSISQAQSLERHAAAVESELGVTIAVYVFHDARPGSSSRSTPDPRDLPYANPAHQVGLLPKQIQDQLSKAKHINGPLVQSVPRFLFRSYPFPLGYISINLPSFTGTDQALRILDATPEFLLPRVLVSLAGHPGDDALASRFVGPDAAVDEFNQTHPHRKLGPILGLRNHRILPHAWNDQMHVAHIFDHPRYAERPTAASMTREGATPSPGAFVPSSLTAPHRPAQDVVVRRDNPPLNGSAPAMSEPHRERLNNTHVQH